MATWINVAEVDGLYPRPKQARPDDIIRQDCPACGRHHIRRRDMIDAGGGLGTRIAATCTPCLDAESRQWEREMYVLTNGTYPKGEPR